MPHQYHADDPLPADLGRLDDGAGPTPPPPVGRLRRGTPVLRVASRATNREEIMAPPKIPLPTDEELEPEQLELLANLPRLNVFRMVAGAPRALRSFLGLGGAVLSTALDAQRREIAVLRVAHATSAPYEWAQHEQFARNVGVSEDEIEAIGREEPVRSLDEERNLICRVADEVTRDVRLSDEALEQIIDRYGPREAAELILLVSYYNMVSRFLESTRVEIEEEPLLEGQTPASMRLRREDGR
jgi:4-carboxymuconolactone decarboxylase